MHVILNMHEELRMCIIIHTVRRNRLAIHCLVATESPVVQLHNASENALGVISRQGVIQCWSVNERVSPKLNTGLHAICDSGHIATRSDQLPDKSQGHILILMVTCMARNILLAVTPEVFKPFYPGTCWWALCGFFLYTVKAHWGFVGNSNNGNNAEYDDNRMNGDDYDINYNDNINNEDNNNSNNDNDIVIMMMMMLMVLMIMMMIVMIIMIKIVIMYMHVVNCITKVSCIGALSKWHCMVVGPVQVVACCQLIYQLLLASWCCAWCNSCKVVNECGTQYDTKHVKLCSYQAT